MYVWFGGDLYKKRRGLLQRVDICLEKKPQPKVRRRRKVKLFLDLSLPLSLSFSHCIALLLLMLCFFFLYYVHVKEKSIRNLSNPFSQFGLVWWNNSLV